MARFLSRAFIDTKKAFEENKEKFKHFHKIDDVEVYVNCYDNKSEVALVTTKEWKDYVRGHIENPPN